MNEYVFIDKVCELFQLDVDKLLSNCRKGIYPDVRKMLMFKLKKDYKMNQKQIAELTKKSNHSVVSTSIKKHLDFMKYDKKYKEMFNSLEINNL